ncbi:MAG: hypothetical protein JXA13_10300 [Anaerolineales bacterium]|nr:hypothetical protein [Anaerolineales bacterium]
MLKKNRRLLVALLVSVLLVVFIDLFTNRLDIVKFSWDFKYYIDLARNGFAAKPLLGPYAYRFITPFIAGALNRGTGLSLENGFKVVAYAGAISQLLGIYLFIKWFTKSEQSAYIAMLVTAFSMCNLKFLVFDVYRPDHLAYAFVIALFFFSFKQNYLPLLFATTLGFQFREYALVPLFSYLLSFVSIRKTKVYALHLLGAALVVFAAILLPMMLIPVTGSDLKFLSFDSQFLHKLGRILFDLQRNFIFLYAVTAYLLPSLMLLSFKRIKAIFTELGARVKWFLAIYTLVVLALSLVGGHDFCRYVTYLFVPQAIIVALAARTASKYEIAAMLAAVFIYNRIWAQIPMDNVQVYLEFLHGYSNLFSPAVVWSFIECLLYILAAFILRQFLTRKAPEKMTSSS